MNTPKKFLLNTLLATHKQQSGESLQYRI